MRIFLSTFFDVPDNADIQTECEKAINNIGGNHSDTSDQLLNNIEYWFLDNSDKE